jgi:glycosyltransferase involved in cell wall biosynthesis
LVSLVQLYRIFRKERFDVVHSLMPKTALLAMLAALISGVPNRIHTFTGQVWANKVGAARWGLKAIDKLVTILATGLLTDGFSQSQYLIEQLGVRKEKILVLGHGSVCGVDTERFKPNLTKRHYIRSKLGIPNSAIVYLFLGRLNVDKGILDLAHAFAELAINMNQVHLIVVGPDESEIGEMLELILAKCLSQFHRIGFANNPEDYMACADIFCLPSYREGFGSVIIEAAAVGAPAVATNIYGLVDAVKDGESGILFEPKNITEMKKALLILTNDTDLREKMAKCAMERVHAYFTVHVLVTAMRQYYQKLLS